VRSIVPERLERGRWCSGPMGSDASYGLTGMFTVIGPGGRELKIMSSGPEDRTNWEHVSVSLENRPPNWAEMAFVCDLFWGPEECVVQYRPPHADYINNHPNCLHWFKWTGGPFPMPPSHLVGIKLKETP
jgi:hypothetical protein